MFKAIDVWVNVFLPEFMKRDWADKFPVHGETKHAIEMMRMGGEMNGYTPAEYVAKMDKLGIEISIIPAWKMGTVYHKLPLIWDYSIEDIQKGIIEHYPDRFRAHYGINPWMRMEGVRELERAVKEYGFVGAHMHPFGFAPVNHKLWYPFYAKCVELDVPVISQIGHSGEVMYSDYGRPIYIDEVAVDFPELRFVASHTGWPWVEELVAMAWKHPNVYIATSAHLPRYWDPSLVNFINTRGQDKVLWGSDWPVTAPERNLAQLEEMGLKEEPKKKLLRENAIRVYKLA